MLDEVIDLEIVPPDPVELEVHGDVVDDIDLVSEQGRQPSLVGGSLVPLSPVSQERLRGRELTGLKNLGNTCYMNSILQCVSNTPPLAHYFVSRSYLEDINDKYSETRGNIAREFAEVLTHLWSSQYKSISASDLGRRVGRAKSRFFGRDQQDSHEFLLSLLEWLHDDTNKVTRLPMPSSAQRYI